MLRKKCGDIDFFSALNFGNPSSSPRIFSGDLGNEGWTLLPRFSYHPWILNAYCGGCTYLLTIKIFTSQVHLPRRDEARSVSEAQQKSGEFILRCSLCRSRRIKSLFPLSQYASCTDDCSSDGDCPGETEKCCYNGCGR